MQPVELARIAAEAEAARWQAIATRTLARLMCVVIALLFAVGAVTVAHVAAWYALRVDAGLRFYWSALIVGGFDLVVAAVLLLFASRSKPSRVEQEALAVRRQAVAGLMSMLSLVQLTLSALRLMGARRRRR